MASITAAIYFSYLELIMAQRQTNVE